MNGFQQVSLPFLVQPVIEAPHDAMGIDQYEVDTVSDKVLPGIKGPSMIILYRLIESIPDQVVESLFRPGQKPPTASDQPLKRSA